MMKLNVLLITYNQEQYIEQTLDSILMQKTTFDFNVIMADDCSSDRTVEIIKQYSEKTTIEFIFLAGRANLGFNMNYKRAFNACDAEYIAIMEGDDYWTDPQRLQKHADFLDNHQECSMSFNRIVFYHQDQADYKINNWDSTEDYKLITSKQMIVGNRIGNLSACVFRKKLVNKLKPELFELGVADWMLGIIFGQYGFIAELKEATSVYRIHGKGLWSKQNEDEQIHDLIKNIPIYNKYLDYKFNDDFVRYENYLKRSLTKEKKRGISDYIPPIFIYIAKLFIPSILLKK